LARNAGDCGVKVVVVEDHYGGAMATVVARDMNFLFLSETTA
jgi:hypothetical protein